MMMYECVNVECECLSVKSEYFKCKCCLVFFFFFDRTVNRKI